MRFKNGRKFLVLLADSRLTFREHIATISSNISKSVGIFYRLKSIVLGDILHNLYYSFEYPYLLYCIAIFRGTHSSVPGSIKKTTKRYSDWLRENIYLAHTNQLLFVRLKILKLDDIYKFKFLCLMFNRVDCVVRPSDSLYLSTCR